MAPGRNSLLVFDGEAGELLEPLPENGRVPSRTFSGHDLSHYIYFQDLLELLGYVQVSPTL
jgi:hypothetical protein